MASRRRIITLVGALASLLCVTGASYGQSLHKASETLQYVLPPTRVVQDSETGEALIATGVVSRYATVTLSPASDDDFCGQGCVSKVQVE